MKYWTRVFLVIGFILTGRQINAQNVPPGLEISHLTGDFYVFTTYSRINNAFFPANGMYMVTNEGVVLLDTPWDPTQFQPLLDSITQKHHQPVILAIATHSHEDRTAGLTFFQKHGAKTYTSKSTDEISIQGNGVRAQYLFEKDTIFRIGQHTMRINYPGRGHTSDNIVVWFEKDKILYGGCLIKSVDARDLGNLSDASVPEWKTTIKNLKKTYRDAQYIIPGHQSWDSKRSLSHTLNLIRKYEHSR